MTKRRFRWRNPQPNPIDAKKTLFVWIEPFRKRRRRESKADYNTKKTEYGLAAQTYFLAAQALGRDADWMVRKVGLNETEHFGSYTISGIEVIGSRRKIHSNHRKTDSDTIILTDDPNFAETLRRILG